MMVSVLPKQLERLATLHLPAKMCKHLGNFPATLRSSNNTKCDTNLTRSMKSKITDGHTY